ncbi:hypothetical protein [Jonquetella anthropi]|nr:hypothetical protein [Jonquetella anthropi]
MKTGFQALKLAVAGFLIPYFFVYSPELLMIQANASGLILPIVTSIIGAILLAFAGAGFWLKQLNIIQRVCLFAAALLLIKPGLITDLCGIGIAAAVFIWQKALVSRRA